MNESARQSLYQYTTQSFSSHGHTVATRAQNEHVLLESTPHGTLLSCKAYAVFALTVQSAVDLAAVEAQICHDCLKGKLGFHLLPSRQYKLYESCSKNVLLLALKRVSF